MKEAVEEMKAVEQRRGRRYKERDRMVEEGDYFFGEYFGREFLPKKGVKKVLEQRGKKTGGGG